MNQTRATTTACPSESDTADWIALPAILSIASSEEPHSAQMAGAASMSVSVEGWPSRRSARIFA